jgi:hypothetical protein
MKIKLALLIFFILANSSHAKVVSKTTDSCVYESHLGKLELYNDSADYLWNVLFTNQVMLEDELLTFYLKDYATVTNLHCNNGARYSVSLTHDQFEYSFEVHNGFPIIGTTTKSSIPKGRCLNSQLSKPDKQLYFCICINENLGEVYGEEHLANTTDKCLKSTQ